MKQLILGLSIGFAIGLTCTACSLALPTIKAEPLTVVLIDRNFVQTTKVTTEEELTEYSLLKAITVMESVLVQ